MFGPAFTVVAAVAGAAPAVVIDGGAATCPGADDVAAALAELLPERPADPDAAPDRVRIAEDADAIWVRLVSAADGTLLGERRLERAGGAGADCRALAAAAAVVVAVWETDVHPEYAARWPAAARPVDAAARREPERRPAGARGGSLGVEVGAALGWSWSSDLAPVGEIEATASAAGGALGFRLAAQIGTAHRVALASGAVEWWRLPAIAGARLRIRRPSVTLDVQAGGVLALVIARGSGFDGNLGARGLAAGGALGLRFAWPREGWAPYVGLQLLAWPLPDTVYQQPAGTSRQLPAVEAGVFLGAATIR